MLGYSVLYISRSVEILKLTLEDLGFGRSDVVVLSFKIQEKNSGYDKVLDLSTQEAKIEVYNLVA